MSEAHFDNREKLTRMAGQIAAFFNAYPHELAVEGVAQHINKFWSKKMRQEFMEAYATDQSALPPLLKDTLPKLKGYRTDNGA